MIRALFSGGLTFLVATWGVWRLRAPDTDVNTPVAQVKQSTKKSTKVRRHLVRTHCPPGLPGFEQEIAEVNRETSRVKAEIGGLKKRTQSLGAAWPESLNEGIEPEVVRPLIEALLPEDAIVTWACEEAPCTAMIVLPGASSERTEELRRQINEQMEGAPSDVIPIDDEAYSVYDDGDRQASELAIYVHPMPELTEESHKARAYYMSRHPPKWCREQMRLELMER